MSPQKANKPAPNKIAGQPPGAAVKEGWQTKNLGDVATLQRGFDLPTQNRVSGPYPLVSSSGISDTHHQHAVRGPGVVTGRSGSIGNVFFIEEDFWPLNTTLYIKDFHGNDPRFVFYLLNDFDLKRFSSGTGVPTLNRNFVHDERVFVPTLLAEQKRIVALLDEAFAGIATAKANAEKNLQNARAVFESHLHSVFTQRGEGWDVKPLGELSQFKNGLNYNKRSGGQTLPVVGVADFHDNDFVPISDLQSATIDGDLADNYAIQRNDILAVRSNGSKHLVGRCMLVGDVDELVSYSGFIIRIRFDAKIVFPEFLLHFMKCKATRDILTAGGGGANITNINQEKLSSLLVPLPPYKTQVQVASALDSMRAETQRLASIYEKKIAALDALKKALLRQAFAGEL
ncbi:MAG: restriction endonuclease subunit S [Myxococcales bacterium]|nr:restriction endonuclease subunit S [Myxococcales bacterium]